uniref:Uncharacterized protein n=1 Tax=Glossina austeni TaxID=7395 RepID=A0A1A9V3T4_GLOAU
MGGVVVGRLHPAPGVAGTNGHHLLQQQLRIQAPHLGVIKVETSPNSTPVEYNNNSSHNISGSGVTGNSSNSNTSTHRSSTNEG